MSHCRVLKEYLAEHDLPAVRGDQQLVEHVNSCAVCTKLLQAYAEISELLDELPEHEPPTTLLAGTADAIKAPANGKSPVSTWNGRLAAGMGTAIVVLAAFGLSQRLVLQDRVGVVTSVDQIVENRIAVQVGQLAPQYPAVGDGKSGLFGKTDQSAVDSTVELNDRDGFYTDILADSPVANGDSAGARQQSAGERQPLAVVGGMAGRDAGSLSISSNISSARRSNATAATNEAVRSREVFEPHPSPVPAEVDYYRAFVNGEKSKEYQVDNGRLPGSSERTELAQQEEKKIVERLANLRKDSINRSIIPTPDTQPQPVEKFKGSTHDDEFESKNDAKLHASKSLAAILTETVVTGNAPRHTTGFDFLHYYQQTDDLSFQSPDGYWSNAYVPGDPQIRLLSARLASWDRTALGETWRLEQDITPVKQPFDAPDDNALALTLMADANAVDGPTRMRLQVGIRGIEHLRGQRPAMNLSVVIDLPDDAEDSVRIATRALVEALLSSKQAGDRFSLVLRGDGQNATIAPEDFRFGPLQLAIQAIMRQDSPPAAAGGDLLSAMQNAADFVRSDDDPGQPLGSSAIMLISAGTLSDLNTLAEFVHRQARDGITLSVFPLGDLPRSKDVDTLVLAGLGNRRYLDSPDQARSLIAEELYSASRAVARAARLSIRLATGVHLIEVVDSRRLDMANSQRVKEIETSIDQRLRANLGIEADRGEDEGGIQIVIPSVFADDSLTVLLDVVVDKAGPIADVSLRYKDLVFKKNGVLRGHFAVQEGSLDRQAAELAVLKNLAAYHFRESVTRAADALGHDQVEQAMAELSLARATLIRLRDSVSAWEDDRDLIRDQQILERYLSVLTAPEAITYQPLLADSLRYAGWAKAHGGAGDSGE